MSFYYSEIEAVCCYANFFTGRCFDGYQRIVAIDHATYRNRSRNKKTQTFLTLPRQLIHTVVRSLRAQ